MFHFCENFRCMIFCCAIVAISPVICQEVALVPKFKNDELLFQDFFSAIECVSSEFGIRDGIGDTQERIDVKIYIKEGYYAFLEVETEKKPFVTLELSKGISLSERFKCVTTPSGKLPGHTKHEGLITFSGVVSIPKSVPRDDLKIFGEISVPICSQTSSVLVKKRFCTFQQIRGLTIPPDANRARTKDQEPKTDLTK